MTTDAVTLQSAIDRLQRGDVDGAERVCLAILAASPDHFDARHLLGFLALQAGRSARAVELIAAALPLNPDFAPAWNNLGLALAACGRLQDAVLAWDRAVALAPGFADAHNNRGNALRDLGRPDDALASCDAAIALRPDLAEAHNNRGNALFDLDRLDEAIAAFEAAIALRPDYVNAHGNRGGALYGQRRWNEAIAGFDAALAIDPTFADARFHKSFALLGLGRLEEGWREYEWRWRTREMAADLRGGSAPAWRGEPLRGRILYLHAEQGLGDTLQFCRYAPLIGEGGRLVFEAPPSLKRLLTSLPLPDGARVIARGDPIPPFDLHCALLSLPSILGTTLATIPADIPYLAADAAGVSRWRERLAPLAGLKVGLVWSGGQRPDQPGAAAIDRRRSVSLAAMAPLAQVPGVSFVSLQKGAPAAQAAAPPSGMTILDPSGELDDFADTAALVEALDLVISVDTAVAHLAGALGRPVWLLNRYDTCWRWLLDRDDSPWYPSLRQFRQPAPGQWRPVMEAVQGALRALAGGP